MADDSGIAAETDHSFYKKEKKEKKGKRKRSQKKEKKEHKEKEDHRIRKERKKIHKKGKREGKNGKKEKNHYAHEDCSDDAKSNALSPMVPLALKDAFNANQKSHTSSAKAEAKQEPRPTGSPAPTTMSMVKLETHATKKRALPAAPKLKKKKITQEEDIEPQNKWWENADDKGEAPRSDPKWWQMEHHGYLFPPPYEKHGVPLVYDGHKIVLSENAEELATAYAACIGSDHEKKEVFVKNFWESFTSFMTEAERGKITDFEKCDFSLIRDQILEERERKKTRPKEEKEAESKSKRYYQYALVNGVREKVGSFMVEPPSLFRGRGEHPMQGKLKERVPPEECALNCDPAAPVPRVPPGSFPGHCWKEVLLDDSVTWLAYYFQASRGEFKYFFLAGSSGIKGQNDLLKYEKARALHREIRKIRKDYQGKLRRSYNENEVDQMTQLGAATFLIDRLALRVGGEKDTNLEADTVGCTSLRVEHLRFNDPTEENPPSYKVTFDFLGKDSVRYLNEVKLPKLVYDTLKQCTKGKKPENQLFDKIDPGIINQYFKDFMPDLSAKVFRTYNASVTLEEQLAEFVVDPTKTYTAVELKSFYEEANKKVAILCNHQKGVAKSHSEAIENLRTKFTLLSVEMTAVRAKLQAIKEDKAEKTKEDDQFTAKLPSSEKECKRRISQLKDKLKFTADAMTNKENTKNVSLSTSRINYMDPRITVAFCKRVGLDVKQIFSSTVIQKFPWALAVQEDFKFRTEKEIKFEDCVHEARNAMAEHGIGSRDDDEAEASDDDGDEKPNRKRRRLS